MRAGAFCKPLCLFSGNTRKPNKPILFCSTMPLLAGGPVAIHEWAEKHKDSFKPPICNKVLLQLPAAIAALRSANEDLLRSF